MEKILEIIEVTDTTLSELDLNKKIENRLMNEKDNSFGKVSGFVVKTDEQDIILVISSVQSCCESFGYFWTNDDTKEFIGAEVYNVSITNTMLETKDIDKNENIKVDEGDTMFVNIDTDKGMLQFVAYNSHNGYYGHDAYVISNKLRTEKSL